MNRGTASNVTRVIEALQCSWQRGLTCHELAEKLGLEFRTVGRCLKILADNGSIEHLTAKRDGQTIVKLK